MRCLKGSLIIGLLVLSTINGVQVDADVTEQEVFTTTDSAISTSIEDPVIDSEYYTGKLEELLIDCKNNGNKIVHVPSSYVIVKYREHRNSSPVIFTKDSKFTLKDEGYYTILYKGVKTTLIVDKDKPVLNVENGESYKLGKIVRVSDSFSGVKKIYLNDKKLHSKSKFKLNYAGSNKIVVYDKGGNKVTVRVTVN